MNKQHIPHTINFICLLVITATLTLSAGCTARNAAPISKTAFALNTVVTVTVYQADEEALLDSCLALCSEYEALLSKTIPTSDIGRINASAGQPVEVSDDTIYLLQKAICYSELSDGLFDITIEPVASLWDFNSEAAIENAVKPPSETSVTAAMQHVDYHNLQISGNTVTLLDPESSIDLGGIAKGYIADQLKAYLLEQGVQSAIIDLGGNILTIGNRPDGSPFHIGIKRPFDSSGDIITSVNITDQSVVTSGIYERCFTYQGSLYHHILSPTTGYPTDNDLSSVSIIAASSVDCDALSTVCLLLGLEDGKELIESLPDTEAVFITKDNQIHSTASDNEP